MFQLIEQRAKLNSVNPRAEKHGPENVPALDMGFTIKVSNDYLSEFHPKLKSAFYEKPDSPQQEMIDDANHLTQAKFPKLGAIKWDIDLHDYNFTFHYGIGGKSDIEIVDCVVDKFSFLMEEGGTVAISFKVSCHPESAQIGRLCEQIQNDVDISLVYSEPPTQQDLVEQ